ncbi:WhiB family transcriptional regulator [Mycolicibacterium sp. Dal123E01]|uniref:WhiB family transcriptional regulator n=1 Tax=Mycolicibacterium sp. Dal123E01 TaxID=3457578 RepID=UPI00403E4504
MIVQQWQWQSSGNCAGQPGEWFFPEDSPRGEWRRLEQQAKRVCASCPVRLRCLEHALNAPEPYGVWGATTASERGARDLRMRTHTPGVSARSRALGA